MRIMKQHMPTALPEKTLPHVLGACRAQGAFCKNRRRHQVGILSAADADQFVPTRPWGREGQG